MSDIVERPQIKDGKIHNRNEFELCYLRHKYIRKANKNPTKEEMDPYRKIVQTQARRTYAKYSDIFELVGFEKEDLISIGNVHLVSFLGLFAIENHPLKMDSFKEAFLKREHMKAEHYDILDKNKANFTLFLKQRFEDVVRVCGQKARNIKGLPTESYHVFCGPNRPPLVIGNLIKHYEKLGFKKIPLQVFKSIRKKAEDKNNSIFQLNGLWYICVSVEQKELRLVDFCSANQDPYDNLHNMDPEVLCNMKQYEERFEKFKDSGRIYKLNTLKEFIDKHKDNEKYEEEIAIARRMLKKLGGSVG